MTKLLLSFTGKLLRMLLSLVLLITLASVGVWGLLHGQAMTKRVLPLLPGVRVTEPSGALLGDFKARRVDIDLPRGGTLSLLEPAWRGLQIRPDPRVPWQVAVHADYLSAKRLDMKWVPNPAGGPLSDLSIPLSVRVDRVQVDEAHAPWWGATPLMNLDAAVSLQAYQGVRAYHRVKLAGVVWDGWRLSGSSKIGTTAHMAVEADVVCQATPALGSLAQAQAALRVSGPLSRLRVQGDVRAMRPSGEPVPTALPALQSGPPAVMQSLHVDAELAPFDAWPLLRLQAKSNQLNLMDLHVRLPRTALSGEVLIEPAAAHDLRATWRLHNDQPGAWDQALLPVQSLQGHATLIGVRAAKTVDAALKDGLLDVVARLPALGQAEPGELSVKGGWGAARALRADWRGLTPQALHGAAPPLQLQGSLQIKPKWQAGLKNVDQLEAEITADAQGWYGPAFGSAASTRSDRADAAVAKRVPVNMKLAGHFGPGKLSLRSLSLSAQEAQAEIKDALLQWGGPVAWQVKGQVAIQAFDPQVWLPWPAAVKGANKLSGHADVDLNADWRGQIKAEVSPSVMGGMPVQGHVVWQSPGTKPLMQLAVDVDAGGNTVQASADVPWQRDSNGHWHWGADSTWKARVHAPSLQTLQAVAPLIGAKQITGAIEAQGEGQGWWPAMRTQGQVSVSGFQWDMASGTPLKLSVAKADWKLDALAPDALAHLQLVASQGQYGLFKLERAEGLLDGTAKAHRLSVLADLSHQRRAQGPATPLHLEAAAQGAWLRDGVKGASSWQGHFAQLFLRSGGLTPHVLLLAQPFDLSYRWADGARQIHASPTDVNMLGAIMSLRQLDWQADQASGDPVGTVQLSMDMTPLNLATVLDNWQPQAGWGGDLQLTGHVKLSHSPLQSWVVDAIVARQSGDLSLAEPTIEGNVVQRLGIRQASVSLKAVNGVWTMSEQFDGRIIGQLDGRQTVTARRAQDLPSAADPLSGELNMQIKNIRPWGAWAPAGWRLSGQVQAQAKVSGSLGAPQYTGMVDGQGLGLGQALLGVNLSDGILQMNLEGDHVHLTRFSAKAGPQGGSVNADGQAVLGDKPELQLSIKADRFALLQRVDRRVVISGQAKAVANAEEIKVDGRVGVDEGLIDITHSDAPTVGDDVNVVNRPGDKAEEEDDSSSGGNGGAKIKLNVALDVDLGHQLRIKGHGLDAFLTGALRVSTPANRPAIRGAIKVENGTYAAYGQKLRIERGTVTFTGAIENPRLDILAMRAQSPTASTDDVKVGVNITGTALDPRVRLYSDPAMSDTETLSWLVLGRPPTGLGGADVGLLQTAAVALLSGEGASPSDNLVSKLGLDEFSVRQTEAGAVRDTVVNVGKQVSKFWYVGYERNLNATSGNWQLIYRLGQRFTLRAQAGDDNAIDLIRSWHWD